AGRAPGAGGGARGMAHAGVLEVLDDLHVHVDAIAGTSMGAVVGGLYASGMSGREIEQLLESVDWQDAFRDRPPRADLGFRRKQEEHDFLVNLPLGIQGRKLQIPTGLVQGEKLTELIRRATLPVATVTRFDDLRIPFRAVATDLETGASVVMDSGDLTTALRASMSAPGLFAPVERDGRLLVDGGLTENLPIDVARAMGVDVVIVVDAGFPLLPRDRLNSLTSVSNQALAILVRRDVERQLATLGPNDVLVQPALGQRSSYDFNAVATSVELGAAAARELKPRLVALAGAAPEPGQPATAAAAATPIVQFIAADAASNRYQRMLNAVFADQIGKPLDADVIDERIKSIYGQGNLELLDYRVDRTPQGATGLVFTARRNSWGPNYLRLGLSLEDDFAGNSTFNAAGRVSFTELNALGAEAVLDLQVGAAPRVAAEFYQPLSALQRYFIAPHLQAEAHNVPQLQDGETIGSYRVRTFEYGLDAGREFGNWGELRGGLLDTRGTTAVRLGDFSVPEVSYHTHAGFVRFNYDRLDSTTFPRSGQALTLQVRAEQAGRGAAGSDTFTFDWRGAWSHGKNTAVAWLSAGSTIGGSDTNVRAYFPLGGFLNLSGLPAQSLAGPHYAIARVIYLRSVGRGGEGVLNVPAYAGISYELGNVWSDRSEISIGSARSDASLFFGADTYIGPAYLAVGYDQGGNTAFYLFLGRSF
ncbi:MAG: patatin-like phospholipase family protein, partial [Proteobacteria bacterium]|nr:patatin-like phospholipase family protein [Pseudomonadota bacterium]